MPRLDDVVVHRDDDAIVRMARQDLNAIDWAR
jgi:hypothetical protein